MCTFGFKIQNFFFFFALLLLLEWPKTEDFKGLISSLERSSLLGIRSGGCSVSGGQSDSEGRKMFFPPLFTKRAKILPQAYQSTKLRTNPAHSKTSPNYCFSLEFKN